MASFPLRAHVAVLFMFIATCGAWASEAQSQHKELILTTVDGVKIRASEISTGKDTMLIYCHRLLSSKDSLNLNGFGQVFLREFDLLALDFRGHNESEWFSNCGGDEVLDLRAVIQYAKKAGHRKIALLGVGMGGIAAIRAAALFGNVDAVIAVSPCGQPEKLRPWWWNLATNVSLTTDYGKIPIRILSSARISGRYWTGSPIYLIDRVSPAPLLIIHGQADRYVNDEQIQELYDRAREPKELIILPRSEHAEGLLDDVTAELIVDWLRKALADQASQPSRTPIPISSIGIHGHLALPEEMIERTVKAASDGASDLHEEITRIKEEVEDLHKFRGYTLCRVSEVDLSPDGRLSLNIQVGQVDHLRISGSRRIPLEQIRQTLQIADGHSYNAWEIESAVKRLRQFPGLAGVESQLKQDANSNTVEILVEERNPWSLGVAGHFTDFDQFGGVQISFDKSHPGAWRGYSQMLLGLQHQELLYRVNVEKGWFRHDALLTGFGFERFIYSWDNVEYYFERQEAKGKGGNVYVAYKPMSSATVHLDISRKRFATIDWDEALPVDEGFTNALNLRLENRGSLLRGGEKFLNWRSQAFLETATTRFRGDHDYTVFQLNLYPQLNLSGMQTLGFGLHWGLSTGGVPQQKLFSLGGDTTLPGYRDDAFLGEHVYLLRARYDLQWGKWLGETSRLAPLGVSLLFDAGDIRMRDEPLKFEPPKLEIGLELNYASTIRIGFVEGLGKEKKAFRFYFGWHPHLVRPRL